MKEQKKPLDFRGIKLFIGIDIHLKQWTVTIRTSKLVLKIFSMNPSPQELFNYLKTPIQSCKHLNLTLANLRTHCLKPISNELINLDLNNFNDSYYFPTGYLYTYVHTCRCIFIVLASIILNFYSI